MKATKKLIAVLLTAIMVLSLGVTAFATNSDGTSYEKGSIEIKNPQDGVTYTAYKIFDTTYDLGSTGTADDKYAYTIAPDWVNDVVAYATPANTTLADDWTTTTANGLTVTKAVDASGAVTAYNVTFDSADFSAADFGAAMAGKTSGTPAKTAVTFDPNSHKAENLDLGYYMIQPSSTNALVSLTTTDKDVQVSDKNEKPPVEKKIVEEDNVCGIAEHTHSDECDTDGDGTPDCGKVEHTHTDDCKKTDHNTANIGDTIDYELVGKVPDMTGYDWYFYVVNDVLSKGLTFNNDVEIKMWNGTSYDTLSDTAYTVKTEKMADGSTELRIVFNNMLQYQALNGNDIVINYSVLVNEDAEMGTDANTNTAKIEYSSDPNIAPEGGEWPVNPPSDPRDPDYTWQKDNEGRPITPVGEGPESTTKTYVAELKLTKVDGTTTTTTLTGAKFKLEGDSKKVVMVNEEIFKEDANANPAYYRLKDGTYTTAAPVDTTVEGATLSADTYTAFTGDRVSYEELSSAEKPAVGLFYDVNGTKTEITAANKDSVPAGATLYLPTYNTLGLYTAENASSKITDEATAKAYAVGDNKTAALYTRTVNQLSQDAYEDATTKYAKVDQITTTNASETYTTEGYVDANGVITFAGLGEGTYTITELVAPDGYNLLTEPIEVVVSLVEGSTAGTYSFQATVDGTDVAEGTDGMLSFNVANNKGAELPETGGIGTTVFYVVGGILIAGAATLLITKKRFGAEG